MEEHLYDRGEVVGNYQILGHLASGAWSAVYRAQDLEDAPEAAPSALKTCRFAPQSLSEAERLDYNRRLDREFRLISNLNHPSVVAALECRYHAGLAYAALEVLEGPTLGRFMREARRPFAVLLDLFQQLAEALAYCHRHGVIHRDLHPQNILISTREKRRPLKAEEEWEEGLYDEASTITEQGRAGRQGVIRTPYVPVLVDFSISHDLGSPPITEPGRLLGAPQYLPPEYARAALADGLKQAHSGEPSEDVFALGVVLYEMLTGRLPTSTPARHLMALLREIRDREPAHPRELNPEAPPAFSDLAMRCLHKRHDQRPLDGSELLWRANVALQEDAPHLQKLAPEYGAGREVSEPVSVILSLSAASVPGALASAPPTPGTGSTAPAGIASAAGGPLPQTAPGAPTPPPAPPGRPAVPARWLAAAALGGLASGVLVFVLVLGSAWLLFRSYGQEPGELTRGTKRASEELTTGRPMPRQPLKDQVRPPCPSTLHKVINDACWAGPFEDEKPPCAEAHYSHNGGCYAPVFDYPPRPDRNTEKRLDGGQ